MMNTIIYIVIGFIDIMKNIVSDFVLNVLKKNKKIDQIKNNDCKIITEPLDLKKYLQNWIFFFSEKMPQTKELYVQELIKVGNELIQLKRNRFICETQKPLFISWYLYKLAKIKKDFVP